MIYILKLVESPSNSIPTTPTKTPNNKLNDRKDSLVQTEDSNKIAEEAMTNNNNTTPSKSMRILLLCWLKNEACKRVGKIYSFS